MSFIKRSWEWFLLLPILACMVALRSYAYGDLRLAVATTDTASYIESARTPLTQNTLTGVRLFTTNLLFKLTAGDDCASPPFSIPARGEEIYRSRQPCFDTIILIQNIFSMIGWGLLAIVLARRLAGFYSKLLVMVLIPAFGFTPRIADWDSILGSESLTFSLFAIALACLLEISFQIFATEGNFFRKWLLPLLTTVVLILWVFTRDANIYTLIILSILAVPLFMSQRIWKQKQLVLTILGLALISIIGMQSATASGRWKTPLTNVFNDLILPYSTRETYMRDQGMPDPGSSVYEEWFKEGATRAYGRFLVSHPGYVAATLIPNLEPLFTDNSQPYFLNENSTLRNSLLVAGNIMHPTTYLILILDILFLIALLVSALNLRGQREIIWAWFGLWLFISASTTLFISYFADSIGVTRHTLFSVEMFRLMFWLFLIVLIDIAATGGSDQPI